MQRITGVSRQIEKALFHGNCRPSVQRDRTKFHRKEKHKARSW